MHDELKRDVIPALGELGFKGSMPKPHRISAHVDSVTFQFASGGSAFAVEIGAADQQRENAYSGKILPKRT